MLRRLCAAQQSQLAMVHISPGDAPPVDAGLNGSAIHAPQPVCPSGLSVQTSSVDAEVQASIRKLLALCLHGVVFSAHSCRLT